MSMARNSQYSTARDWQAIVADDDEDWRSIAARALRRAGVQVLEARNGDEILAYHRVARGSAMRQLVIVSDLDMPTCDGITAVSALREMSSKTPVLVVTGLADATTRQRAIRAGANAVVHKPLTPEGLVNAVAALLEARNAADDDKGAGGT
jgi:CheY-like chemotaxis protein